ncbi:Reducing polyketide synthase pksF [Colletotrichum orbiculare MAFF 240422]|uniref:Reducing polyketide synthase pksF n=1 Tax=Colletotrichum orbiculare (strain 104-T / ATCC 96160 / CBS 514.97 / LARS 414 / MAFF 240422) TaxID=1213857 RepID=A0A484FHV6_COLOR|nr:Reducing polyketide synthase pksF [Colletotrichum orbiculare MAFF 240422]
MLAVAIEAARQLAASVEDRILGNQLDNVRFLRAVNVNESERGVEAKIVMRRRGQATNTSGQKLCYDWRFFGTNGDDWDECAHGSNKVELQPESDLAPEQARFSETRRRRFARSVTEELEANAEKCRLIVHHSQLYRNMLKRSGFDYGPYFQLLREISYDGDGHATAILPLRDYALTMRYAGEDPCVGGGNPVPTIMFSHLRKLWVSQQLFKTGGNPQLRVATHETMRAFREAECRTTVVFDDTAEPVIVLDGQRGTAITSLQKSAEGEGISEDSKQLLYSLEYKPHLSLLSEVEKSAYLTEAFKKDSRCRPSHKEIVDLADAISLHFIEAALDRINRENQPIKDKWTLQSRDLGHLDIQGVLREADSEPTQRLSKKIIFEGNLADEFYYCDVFRTNNSKMGAYMDHLAHMNPKLRVLEVGAGTGSSTGRILPYLSVQGEEWGLPGPVR